MKSERYLKDIGISLFVCLVLVLIVFLATGHCQVSPFQGLGNVQFFDNNGAPLTAGVLYSFQAGTSTQQATYTDSTGTVLNPNPIPFGSGARVSIWLSTGAFYKFVLCLQNDGAVCAPADVLFSVDQVPGGATGGVGGGGGSPFTGIFISSSANQATSGILRLASGDTLCYRNVAGSANLCWSKDTNDLLTWAGGSLKFPEVAAPSGVVGFDEIWADSTSHRFITANNGNGPAQLVVSGRDINTSDQVTSLHFGSTATPISGTAPTTGQYLSWNGTSIIGLTPPVAQEATLTGPFSVMAGNGAGINCGTGASPLCIIYSFGNAHTLTRLTVQTVLAASGCTTNAVVGVKDITTSTVLLSQTATALGAVTTTGAVAIPAGDLIGIGVLTVATGCTQFPTVSSSAIYQ
jgi:hypothetical protein